MEYQRIGDMLLGEGIVTKESLDRVTATQKKSRARLGELLVAMGLATEDQVTDCLARQYNMPRASLSEVHSEPNALNLVDPFHALSNLILPVKVDGDVLYCVISDPLDVVLTDELSVALHRRIVTWMAAPTELYNSIIVSYGMNVPLKAEAGFVTGATRPGRKKSQHTQEDRQALLFALDNAYEFLDRQGLGI
ncbi:MAG: hypothetical protein K8R88_07055 [Armatimonadetes bacterium]|nr:hypothetical protein [Armatimonadota bacterium]